MNICSRCFCKKLIVLSTFALILAPMTVCRGDEVSQVKSTQGKEDTSSPHLPSFEIIAAVYVQDYGNKSQRKLDAAQAIALMEILHRANRWSPDVAKGPAPLLPPFYYHLTFVTNSGLTTLVDITYDGRFFQIDARSPVYVIASNFVDEARRLLTQDRVNGVP